MKHRSSFFYVGIPLMALGALALIVKASLDGISITSGMVNDASVFIAFAGLGLFCFLVVYYLAKIANKK